MSDTNSTGYCSPDEIAGPNDAALVAMCERFQARAEKAEAEVNRLRAEPVDLDGPAKAIAAYDTVVEWDDLTEDWKRKYRFMAKLARDYKDPETSDLPPWQGLY